VYSLVVRMSKYLTCDLCDYKSTRSYNIERHMKTVHKWEGSISKQSEDTRERRCEGCFKTFQTANGIYKHRKICKQQGFTTLCNFNEENTSYITDEFWYNCFEEGFFGIHRMMDAIYFNDDHPENHNVRVCSLKHSLADAYINGKWTPIGLRNLIERMINNTVLYMVNKRTAQGPVNSEQELRLIYLLQNIPSYNKRFMKERLKNVLVDKRHKNKKI
jgi:hypothetical protein